MTSQTEHFYALPTGTRLAGEYVVEGILGHGGFGITYLARDEALDTHVAIKEYLPSELAVRDESSTVRPVRGNGLEDFASGLEAFLKEARLVARMDKHPNLVAVRRFFRENGTAYMVMDYVEGVSLDELIGRHADGLPANLLLPMLDRLLDGLSAVHAGGALHRDIKASNILIRDDATPVLIDFGSARHFSGSATRTMTALVSSGYAPIEQYTSDTEQGPYSDLYALGAVAYKAITGGAPPEALRRLRRDPMVPAAEVGQGRYPASLLASIDKALAVDPSDRFQSADEMRVGLRAPSSAPTSSARGPAAAKAPKTAGEAGTGVPRNALVVGAITLSILGAAAWWITRDGSGSEQATGEVVVDASGKSGKRSFAEALAQVAPGGVVRVLPGTYREALTLDKAVSIVADGEVTLAPPGDWCIRIPAPAAGPAPVSVQGLKIQARAGTCITLAGDDTQLQDIEIAGSPGIGIRVERGAASLTRLTVQGATQYGLLIEGDAKPVVSAASIRRSGLAGIAVRERAEPQISDSTVIDSSGSGVLVSAEAKPRLSGLKVQGSALSGIEVLGKSMPTVSGSQVADGQQSGIYVHGEAGGSFENNEISKSLLSGIVVEGGEPRFKANRVSDAGEHGIYVSGAAKPHFEENTVSRSTGHGLAVDATAAAHAARNTFVSNRTPQIVRTNSATITASQNTLQDK